VLTRDLDRGVELLADNELHPAFPREALDVIKRQVARVVTAQLKSPGYMMQRSLREALYPKAILPTRCDAGSVRSLTIEDVKAYYRSASGSPCQHRRDRPHHAGACAQQSRNIRCVEGRSPKAAYRFAGGARRTAANVVAGGPMKAACRIPSFWRRTSHHASHPDYYAL